MNESVVHLCESVASPCGLLQHRISSSLRAMFCTAGDTFAQDEGDKKWKNALSFAAKVCVQRTKNAHLVEFYIPQTNDVGG